MFVRRYSRMRRLEIMSHNVQENKHGHNKLSRSRINRFHFVQRLFFNKGFGIKLKGTRIFRFFYTEKHYTKGMQSGKARMEIVETFFS